MNPNLELQEVIECAVYAQFGEDDGLSAIIFNDIRNWMDRNMIVFYQP